MPRTVITAAVLAATLLLAACGGSGAKPGSGSGQEAALAFSKCMRANGVASFPDPTEGSGGGIRIQASQRAGSGRTMTVNGVPVSAPAFQSAMQKCQKDLPHKGAGAVSLPKLRTAALAMARCMRAHGVPNFPDPQVSSGQGGGVQIKLGGPGSDIDPQSPAFQSASKICQPLLNRAGIGPPKGAAQGPAS